MIEDYKTYKKLGSSATEQQCDATFIACLANDIGVNTIFIDEILSDDMPEVVRRLKSLKERHEYALMYVNKKHMAEKFVEEMDIVMKWIGMITDILGEVQEHFHKMIEMEGEKFDFVAK